MRSVRLATTTTMPSRHLGGTSFAMCRSPQRFAPDREAIVGFLPGLSVLHETDKRAWKARLSRMRGCLCHETDKRAWKARLPQMRGCLCHETNRRAWKARLPQMRGCLCHETNRRAWKARLPRMSATKRVGALGKRAYRGLGAIGIIPYA